MNLSDFYAVARTSRPGNTISSTLRKGWDSKKRLTVEGKIAPARATNPHVSMLGHITSDELLSCLNEIENKNGFSNRVLWLATYRTKELSIPPWINWDEYPDIVGRLAEIVKIFGTHGLSREFNWSSEGEKEWDKFYKSVKCSGSGIVGSILARSHAHVLRLTMLFTVLDNSSLMEPQHLRAAIAFWQYCVRSAMWIFGEKTGNKSADKIYWALQRAPGGMTRTDITADVFNRHVSKVTLDQALSELVKTGLARFASERVKGDRPAQRWFAKTE